MHKNRTSGMSNSTYLITLKLGPKNNPWQKEKKLDDFIVLVTWLMYNREIWTHFFTKSRNQFYNVTNQFQLSMRIPCVSLNLIPYQEVKSIDLFLRETWSVNYKWHWEIASSVCAGTSDSQLRVTKFFLRKLCNHYQNFMRKFQGFLEILKIFFEEERRGGEHLFTLKGRRVNV